MAGSGTPEDPWRLKTARAPANTRCTATRRRIRRRWSARSARRQLKYHLSAIDDLAAWLRSQGDWVPLGAADEQKPAADGTVEAWGRDASNPVGGWYGLRKGYRGRFGMYLPPLLEELGLVELTHDARNNSVRAGLAHPAPWPPARRLRP